MISASRSFVVKMVFQGHLAIFDLSANGKYEGEQLWKMLIDFYSCVFVQDSFLLKTCSHLGVKKGQRTGA